MSVKTEKFGRTPSGEEITAYTLDDGHLSFRVLDYGAVLVNVFVPDGHGQKDDIVLGYDNADQYWENPSCFGATVGPVCNRTANATFEIKGQTYHMPVNDGVNNLHTSSEEGKGFFKKLWRAISGEDFVTFLTEVPDGECGLPGTREIVVTYSITVDHAIKIHYHATSDKLTLFNMTNHSYFNLDGAAAGSISDTMLQLFCSSYTPVRAGSIPTGQIASVHGTPMDFTEPKKIGRDIDAPFEQLKLTGGYDHNFCVDGYTGENDLVPVARAWSEKTGRQMDVYSTLPGVQFYTGNFIGDETGKGGVHYGKRCAFALETQFYPDSVNHVNFPKEVFGENEYYDATTKYKFSVR
ncbi:MAG TPA: galactose-1-epimerase [Lachnospiraceae bacterium]|jgi:aldose 1-epimerase|nr:galactose-1-epimerase [Lachnospiraceae bacterium]